MAIPGGSVTFNPRGDGYESIPFSSGHNFTVEISNSEDKTKNKTEVEVINGERKVTRYDGTGEKHNVDEVPITNEERKVYEELAKLDGKKEFTEEDFQYIDKLKGHKDVANAYYNKEEGLAVIEFKSGMVHEFTFCTTEAFVNGIKKGWENLLDFFRTK